MYSKRRKKTTLNIEIFAIFVWQAKTSEKENQTKQTNSNTRHKDRRQNARNSCGSIFKYQTLPPSLTIAILSAHICHTITANMANNAIFDKLTKKNTYIHTCIHL